MMYADFHMYCKTLIICLTLFLQVHYPVYILETLISNLSNVFQLSLHLKFSAITLFSCFCVLSKLLKGFPVFFAKSWHDLFISWGSIRGYKVVNETIPESQFYCGTFEEQHKKRSVCLLLVPQCICLSICHAKCFCWHCTSSRKKYFYTLFNVSD